MTREDRLAELSVEQVSDLLNGLSFEASNNVLPYAIKDTSAQRLLADIQDKDLVGYLTYIVLRLDKIYPEADVEDLDPDKAQRLKDLLRKQLLAASMTALILDRL